MPFSTAAPSKPRGVAGGPKASLTPSAVRNKPPLLPLLPPLLRLPEASAHRRGGLPKFPLPITPLGDVKDAPVAASTGVAAAAAAGVLSWLPALFSSSPSPGDAPSPQSCKRAKAAHPAAATLPSAPFTAEAWLCCAISRNRATARLCASVPGPQLLPLK